MRTERVENFRLEIKKSSDKNVFRLQILYVDYIYFYIQGVRKLIVQTLTVGINTRNNGFFKNK